MSGAKPPAAVRNGTARAVEPIDSEAARAAVVTTRDLAEFWARALSRLKDIVEREAPNAADS